MFYEHQDSGRADDYINVLAERPQVLDGDQSETCKSFPEPHLSQPCIFGVKSDEKLWYLCAESPDEAMAWRLAIEDVLQNVGAAALQDHAAYGQYLPGGVYVGGTGGTGQPYYPPQSGYYPEGAGYFPYSDVVYETMPGSTTFVRQPPAGTRVVYVQQRPYYYYNDRYRASDAALAFGTGALMGSMFFWPWMLFPLWC